MAIEDDVTERIQLEGTVTSDAIIGRFTYDYRGSGDVLLQRYVRTK